MKWFVIFCLAGLIGGPVVPLARAAQPDCKFYKATAPILDVRKDAEKPGGYIDVLQSGEIACVTREQKVGSRMWGYVAHKLQEGGPDKPVNGWVGLRSMALQPKTAAAMPANKTKANAPPATPETGLRFDLPVPEGPVPVRGKSLKELTEGQPIFSPIEGLDESLWKKSCPSCHKWNQERLCNQGSSYIKSAKAKAVFRHQHPYGGPYKLALMRWAKSGCK